MTYIKRFFSLFLHLLVFLFILSFFIFSSCSTQPDDDVTPTDNSGQSAIVTFDLSRGGQPATYALNGDAESNVTELDVLLFDRAGKLSHDPVRGVITSMNPATGSGEVAAEVPIFRYGNIILLANSNKMVAAALRSLTIGMSQDDVMKLFEMTLDEKWNTDTSSPSYVGIPMYGQTGAVNVNSLTNNKFSASLLRMLVRVDVYVATPVRPIFSLKNIHVYNRNSVGRLFPSPDNTKVNLPLSPNRVKGPLVYYGAEITTTNISSEGEIYLFESAIVSDVDGNDMRRVDDATCLVIGGVYTPAHDPVNTVVTYYRIDFAHILAADSLKHYYDILRNHQYNINVISVSGPGEKTPEEALNTELSRIEIEVLDWEQGGDIGGDIDGQDILRVAPGSFTFNYTEHTTANINNKIAVSSTHTDGWKVSKVTEFDGTNEIDINGTGWLNTSPAIGAPQTGPTVSLLLKENSNPTPRVGYIYISSGPRMSYKVKVTQREMPGFLGKIIWDGYDGANDTDTGLTTITLEQMGEDTQTSTIKDGVITPKLEVYGVIEKITVTYKGYVLTLLATTHSLDYPNEEISVSDRTLIGKAIHLDKVRNGLAGHYIQVDDIDLNGYTGIDGETNNFKPISSSSTPFKGSYDGGLGKDGQGKGFVMKNLNIDRTTENTSLFGYAINAILKNIHIASGTIKGNKYTAGICSMFDGAGSITGCSNAATIIGSYGVAGICGMNSGKISNCTNSGAIKDFTAYGGGICGENRGSIQDCKNTGDLLNSASVQAGGICGVNSVSYATILRCENTGSVSGFASIGGICGFIKGGLGVAISGCHNSGEVSGQNENIGGICGQNGEISKAGRKIEKSTNKAAVSGTGVAPAILSSYVGGICGRSFGVGSSITNCDNLTEGAIITGTGDYVGGIAGKCEDTTDIGTCKNEATVTGKDYVGGLFGSSAAIIGSMCSSSGVVTGANYAGNICGENKGTITGVTNSTPITSTGGHIGGFVGYNKGTIKDCTNNAAVSSESGTASENIGGIAGSSVEAVSVITNCTNTVKGIITGTGNRVGGITGDYGGNTIVNTNCTNAGKITGANSTGGVFGANSGYLTGCINTGAIKGIIGVGGIAGVSNGTIKDSKNSAPITGIIKTAGICGQNYGSGSITGSHNLDGGTVGGSGSIGGVCGENTNTSTISDCSNNAPVEGTGKSVGGICGYIHNGGSLKDSYNYATVTGSAGEVGGICGKIADAQSSITNCHNAENAKINGKSGQIGGIAGLNTSATISGCTNKAIVAGEGTVTQVGGIVGSNTGVIFAGSNTGAISGTTGVGGIAGINKDSSGGIFGCSNRGPVEGETNLGGISGSNEDAATIIGSMNSATVTSQDTDAFAGGIVGYNLSGVTRACYNIGLVTTYYGAIVGRGTAPVDCFFGGDADGMGTWEGTRRFGADPDWPEDEGAWSTTATNGYWGNLGGWNDGKPIYPTLRIPPPTP